jgi:hypothetical protein
VHMLLILTVDTEADDQWDHGRPLSTDNVRYWAPFQSLCRAHEVSPTYLVTSEIAADPVAREQLRAWASEGGAEIGAHLHPWSTPPYLDRPGLRHNDPAHAFLPELTDDTIRAKVQWLTEEITEAFGIRPTSFRAGRFGFDDRCAAVLAELGYQVDSSVTPMTSMRSYQGLPGGLGGPDFRRFDTRPFVVEGTGSPGLVEIPVTILPTYAALRRSALLFGLYRSAPVRVLRRAALSRWLSPQPVWLQPVPSFTSDDLKAAFSRQSEIAGVAVMMLHSSELMPGGSPFRPDQAAVRELLDTLDSFLGFAREAGAVSSTLTEAALALRSADDLVVRAL